MPLAAIGQIEDSAFGFFFSSIPLLWDLSKVVAGCCENLSDRLS
jgi:hypothetical protein